MNDVPSKELEWFERRAIAARQTDEAVNQKDPRQEDDDVLDRDVTAHPPGPGAEIVLRLKEFSIPLLIDGLQADRVWFEKEADPDVYSLHVTQRIGEIRRQGIEPVSYFLVDRINEFGSVLRRQHDIHDDVPAVVRNAFDELIRAWNDRDGARSAPEGKVNVSPTKEDER